MLAVVNNHPMLHLINVNFCLEFLPSALKRQNQNYLQGINIIILRIGAQMIGMLHYVQE